MVHHRKILIVFLALLIVGGTSLIKPSERAYAETMNIEATADLLLYGEYVYDYYHPGLLYAGFNSERFHLEKSTSLRLSGYFHKDLKSHSTY